MTKEHLTKLWFFLSVACILFLVGCLISIQGGADYFGKLFDTAAMPGDNKPAVGYFATIVGSALFLLASLVLLLHSLRHGENWSSRIPVVWLDGLKTEQWDGKVFQLCIILLFVVAPIAGLTRSMIVAESGDICEQDTANIYRGGDTTLIWAPTAASSGNQMRLRRENSGSEGCTSGVQIFPRSLTPLAFGLLPLAAILAATAALLSLFTPRSRKTETPPDTAAGGPIAPAPR